MARDTLVLFDIDGTLLRSADVGRRSLEATWRDLFAAEGAFEGVRFHGRTDPDILGDGLEALGRDRAVDLPRAIDAYVRHLEATVRGGPSLVLPGVVDLLDALAARTRLALGLVTGNVARGACIKLSRDDLWSRFPVGGFGCDSSDRAELIALAIARAEAREGARFPRERVFYLGDTELDVGAARAAGVRAVAVATGGLSREELAATRPDHLLDGLGDHAAPWIEEVLA